MNIDPLHIGLGAAGLIIGAVGFAALREAVLDFAGRQLADEAGSYDPYGNDRVLGDWPRPAGHDEITVFHDRGSN